MQNIKTSVSDAAAQIYKNMKMGESSVLDLLPKVRNEQLRNEMIVHMEGYQRFSDRAKGMLDAEHKEAKDAGIIAKVSAKMGTAMNTMMDSTASHIAEMMIEGSTMGITDQTRILHELMRTGESKDPNHAGVLGLTKDILSFEEAQIEKMKQFL